MLPSDGGLLGVAPTHDAPFFWYSGNLVTPDKTLKRDFFPPASLIIKKMHVLLFLKT